MDLDSFGYYVCLAGTTGQQRREQTQRMLALVTAENTSKETIAKIYTNRVIVELFFSAPHHSVIGLQPGPYGVEPVLDAGRGEIGELSATAEKIVSGVESFAKHYDELKKRLGLPLSPLQTVWPMIELVTGEGGEFHELLGSVTNFDAWGSSRNHKLVLADYHS